MSTKVSKEERKRKRAQDISDSARSPPKKIKSEIAANGINGVHQNADAKHRLPNGNEHEIPEPGERAVKSGKKRKKRRQNATHADEPAAQNQSASTHDKATDAAFIMEIEGKANGNIIAGDLETGRRMKTRGPESADGQITKKAQTVTNKRKSILRRLSELRERRTNSLAMEDELEEVITEAETMLREYTLAEEDELFGVIKDFEKRRRGDWRISKALGGRFLDIDPIFSEDERYIVLATRNSIRIYEVETSLLASSVDIGGISHYTVSAANAKHMYVATNGGQVHKVDWTNGEPLATFDCGARIDFMQCIKTQDSDEEVLFSIERELQQPRGPTSQIAPNSEPLSLLVSRKAPWDQSHEPRSVLKESRERLQHLRVLDAGRAIFATGASQAFIGTVFDMTQASTKGISNWRDKYHWRHLTTSSHVQCLDVYGRDIAPQAKSDREKTRRCYDFAVGTINGEIHVYQDIVGELERLELLEERKSPQPRVLKWHREAPGAVKWSKDGNYLLSGGRETVLCLWQLETGKRQDLPHLTAGIKGLTVSPQGVMYGVLLSDNSMMVLSTTELTPKTYVSGLQSHYAGVPYNRNPPGRSGFGEGLYVATPLVNDPRNSTSLLLAVPADQNMPRGKVNAFLGRPFLQTFDMLAARLVPRQALTRNVVTETNIDPEWNKIQVPEVLKMRLSHDGMWLATLDEWRPPPHAFQYLAYSSEDLERERAKRRECHLKIWSWNEAEGIWTLNTRIDAPHGDETNESANRSLDLQAHPSRLAFATIGEDSTIKIWRPERSSRTSESVWIVKSIFAIPKTIPQVTDASDFPMPATPTNGHLAFSNDGSVLAVCLQHAGADTLSPVVHLLDADTGSVRCSETSLAAVHMLAMAFLERYLIVVSEDLRVWDVVTGTTVMTRSFNQEDLSLRDKLAMTHLAVSIKDGYFAVAGPGVSDSPKSAASVFRPSSSRPVITYTMNKGGFSALTNLVDGGFVTLDQHAEMRTIRPLKSSFTGDVSVAIADRAREQKTLKVAENDKDEEMEDQGSDLDSNVGEQAEEIVRLVGSSDLAKVLAPGPGSASLSVKDMFDSVTRLFAGKAS